MKITNEMFALFIGSPPPHPIDYQMGCFDMLFGKYSEWTQEERDKEHNRRLKLYEADWKVYHQNREKELDKLKFLLKEKK